MILPMFNHQGNKKESTDLERSLKDDIFTHLEVPIKLSSSSNTY